MNISPLERARRYIAKCLPAISGQSGHNATFYVAAVLVHGFALGEADALVLLREFNQRCLPPWSEGELIHKIKSAANAAPIMMRFTSRVCSTASSPRPAAIATCAPFSSEWTAVMGGGGIDP